MLELDLEQGSYRAAGVSQVQEDLSDQLSSNGKVYLEKSTATFTPTPENAHSSTGWNDEFTWILENIPAFIERSSWTTWVFFHHRLQQKSPNSSNKISLFAYQFIQQNLLILLKYTYNLIVIDLYLLIHLYICIYNPEKFFVNVTTF